MTKRQVMTALFAAAVLLGAGAARAQVPPGKAELGAYSGLHRAAARNDYPLIAHLVSEGANVNARDAYGRTPLHVATYLGKHEAIRALAKAGADLDAIERDRYTALGIAAVRNDVPTLRLLLQLGANPSALVGRYDSTALTLAAQLGNVEAVKLLIDAGAPLDHRNRAGWTAVMETVRLGRGDARHVATLRALVAAGADVNLADRDGMTPLQYARNRGFTEMIGILEKAKR
jgi:ankyrin repeat protein